MLYCGNSINSKYLRSNTLKTAKKSKSAAPNKKGTGKLPGLFSNRRVAVLIVFVLIFAIFGSYRLYITSAADTAKTAEVCRYHRITLKNGSRGGCVYTLQRLLNHFKGVGQPTVATDSQFGPATEKAVKVYQRERGLNPDGIVGYQTWSRLLEECGFYLDKYGTIPYGCSANG